MGGGGKTSQVQHAGVKTVDTLITAMGKWWRPNSDTSYKNLGSKIALGILFSKYVCGMAADLAETRKFCEQSLRKLVSCVVYL